MGTKTKYVFFIINHNNVTFSRTILVSVLMFFVVTVLWGEDRPWTKLLVYWNRTS